MFPASAYIIENFHWVLEASSVSQSVSFLTIKRAHSGIWTQQIFQCKCKHIGNIGHHQCDHHWKMAQKHPLKMMQTTETWKHNNKHYLTLSLSVSAGFNKIACVGGQPENNLQQRLFPAKVSACFSLVHACTHGCGVMDGDFFQHSAWNMD